MQLNSELIITAVMLLAVGLVMFEARRAARADGRANPVGTGRLQLDVTALKEQLGRVQTQMAAMRGDLDDAPTKADLEKLRGEIGQVRGQVDVVCERIEGVHEISEKTDQAVVRIEMLLMGQSPFGQPARKPRTRP